MQKVGAKSGAVFDLLPAPRRKILGPRVRAGSVSGAVAANPGTQNLDFADIAKANQWGMQWVGADQAQTNQVCVT
jgi:hypothetical protein